MRQAYPALNIIGGKRYMKKSSSLNSKIRELPPLVASNRMAPVPNPCHQTINLVFKDSTITPAKSEKQKLT